MRDWAVLMSMFDYDARPVTPGVVLVGTTASRGESALPFGRWRPRHRGWLLREPFGNSRHCTISADHAGPGMRRQRWRKTSIAREFAA